MVFIRLGLWLTCCVALSAAAAVYQTTDEHGNPVFSDVPPSSEAEALELPPTNTIEPVQINPKVTAPEPVAGAIYEHLSIVHPAHDSAVRANDGTVQIEVTLSPALRADHRLLILLDNAIVSDGSAQSLTLSNLSRGSHRLQAKIQDPLGETLIESIATTFHLLRASQ